MLLIFPSIEISHGRCTLVVQSGEKSEPFSSDDPVQMAVRWRGENAKTLHVVDVDGIAEGYPVNRETIARMTEAVDIPVQVCGGMRTYEHVKSLFEVGVYRVVLGTAAVENPALIRKLIDEFGARKIVIAIESRNKTVLIDGGRQVTGLTPIGLASEVARLGVCRVIYSEETTEDSRSEVYYTALQELAQHTNIRVTALGGVSGYRDLVRLQELEKYGVDSVILGKPLYENRFPCQLLWRLNELELTDLGPTRRS